MRVKPGMVLISFKTGRPSAGRKKSTRAIPAQSIARYAATASRWNSLASTGGSSAGAISRVESSTYFAS